MLFNVVYVILVATTNAIHQHHLHSHRHCRCHLVSTISTRVVIDVFVITNIVLPVVQFSSFQSLDRLGRRGDMRDDSVEILFQSFLQEAVMGSSGIGGNVHSLTLYPQHFLCRSRRRPPSKVLREMVLQRLSWRVS